jgi:hypothetical protein
LGVIIFERSRRVVCIKWGIGLTAAIYGCEFIVESFLLPKGSVPSQDQRCVVLLNGAATAAYSLLPPGMPHGHGGA